MFRVQQVTLAERATPPERVTQAPQVTVERQGIRSGLDSPGRRVSLARRGTLAQVTQHTAHPTVNWDPTRLTVGSVPAHKHDPIPPDLMGAVLTFLPRFSCLVRVPPSHISLAPSQNAWKTRHVLHRFNLPLATITRGSLLIIFGSLPILLIYVLQPTQRNVLPHQ